MRHFAAVLVALAALLAFHPSGAAEFGTRDEAVAMVKRVQKMFAEAGAEATFKAVDDKTNPAFHDRDLYPFIYDFTGVCVAHGARPALVGKNLISLKDQNGVYLIQEMVALAKGPGNGWIDYKWPNPITNKIEDKSSYVEKMGNYFVGVGVYRELPGKS
jgi:signal transduction histidine kinase